MCLGLPIYSRICQIYYGIKFCLKTRTIKCDILSAKVRFSIREDLKDLPFTTLVVTDVSPDKFQVSLKL